MLDAEIKFNLNMPAALAKSKRARKLLLNGVAKEVEKAEKLMIQVPGTFGMRSGEVYYHGKRRDIPHQASGPGEPPAWDSGRLASSISTWVDPEFTEAKVGITQKGGGGTDVKYGKWLEFGTHNKDGSVKMAPRPWLRPVLDRMREITAGVMAKFRRKA